VSLFPVHSLIFAAHCANMPELPTLINTDAESPSSQNGSNESSSTTELPVVPMRIPDTATFALLLHYLYTKNASRLAASLVPIVLPSTRPEKLSKEAYKKLLRDLAARVYGFWLNVVALGVSDEKMWAVMEKCWGDVVEALEKACADKA